MDSQQQQHEVQLNQIKQNKPFLVNSFKGKKQLVINLKTGITNLLTITPQIFAGAGSSSTIYFWKLGKQNPVKEITLKNCGSEIWCLDKIDDQIIATGGRGDFSINFYNWKSGDLLKTFFHHSDIVRQIVQLNNSQMFISVGGDRQIIKWDIEGQIVKKIENAHLNSIFSCIKINDNQIVTCDLDNIIKKWQIDTLTLNQQVHVKNGQQAISLVQLNEKLMAVAGFQDGQIKIYDIEQLKWNYSIQVHSANNCRIYKLMKLDESNILSSSFEDKNVKITNWKQGLVKETLNCKGLILCGITYHYPHVVITGTRNISQIIIWK